MTARQNLAKRNLYSGGMNLLLIFARFRELGIGVFIILLGVLVTIRQPSFISLTNLENILLDISILAIVALAQTIVILTRGIDLSVSSMIGLVAMMVAFFVQQNPDAPVILSIVLGMLLGAVLGMFNSLVIVYGKVPPIIATLGTLSIYRGLVFYYSGGTWINSYELPSAFKLIAKGKPFVLPNIVIYAVVIAVIVYLFLNYTRMGRDIFAVGGNPTAAKYVGIKVDRITFIVYVISGIMCGLAAVLWASRFESAQTNTALGFELQTVAAAVVGGVSISGGVGSVFGVLLGALLLGVIKNSLTIIHISPFWQLAAQGLLILVAVVSDKWILNRVAK